MIPFGAAAPLPHYSFLDYMPRSLQICCSTLASPLALSISQWSLSISLVALVYSSPGGAAHFLVLAYQISDVPISLSQNLRTLRAGDSSSRSFDDHRHLVDWPVQLLLEDFATASDDLVDWRPKDFFMRTYANTKTRSTRHSMGYDMWCNT